MAWKIFSNYGAGSKTSITLRKNKMFFISKAILQRYDLQDFGFAVIHVDDDKGLVGIVFASGPEQHARKINIEKSGATISFQPVLRHFGIKIMERENINFKFEKGMLVLDLSKCRG